MDISATTAAGSLGVHHRMQSPATPPPPKLEGTAELGGMKAETPEDAPELSEAQLTEMATNIADGVRPGGPQGGFGPPPPPRGDRAQENLAAVAEALGTDAETLLDKLRSGEDITEWLQSLKAQTGYGGSAGETGGLQVDTYA